MGRREGARIAPELPCADSVRGGGTGPTNRRPPGWRRGCDTRPRWTHSRRGHRREGPRSIPSERQKVGPRARLGGDSGCWVAPCQSSACEPTPGTLLSASEGLRTRGPRRTTQVGGSGARDRRCLSATRRPSAARASMAVRARPEATGPDHAERPPVRSAPTHHGEGADNYPHGATGSSPSRQRPPYGHLRS